MAYSTYATDVRYGPHQQMLLDVYKSSVGESASGNIAIVFQSGGGWNGNDKGTPGAGTRKYDLFNYLADRGSLSNLNNPPINWISVAYPCGGFASTQKACSAEYFPGPVLATQLAIQHVKANATAYGINPAYIYGFGDSAGATNLLLAHFLDSRTFFGNGQASVHKHAQRLSSRFSGVVNFRGQIDYRPVGSNPTMDWTVGPQKLFGVTSNVELAALNLDVLRAASVLYHVQANRASNRTNHVYSLYEDSGGHAIPYSAHDSQQLTTLHDSLDLVGVENVRVTPFAANAWQPGAGTADEISLGVWTWLRARITAMRAGNEPVPT